MENSLEKMNQRFSFIKDPRFKFWGCFLIIVGFALETPLRKISHFLADGFLFLIGMDVSGAGIIIDKLFVTGAPIIFVYIPITIALWMVIKDGFQKLDWIFSPVLIGILVKGGIYGIVSLYSKSSEFWELAQQGVSGFFLWCFILMFLISGLVGLFVWFKNIS